MSSREADDARELRDRDDELIFFTLFRMLPQTDMTLSLRVRRMTTMCSAFIEGRAASTAPRRGLGRRLLMYCALVVGDMTFVEEDRPAGHDHNHSALHHPKLCRPFPFASCPLQALDSLRFPGQKKKE